MSHKAFQEPDIVNPMVTTGGVLLPQWQQWILDLVQWQAQLTVLKPIINPASVAANTSAAQAITITTLIDGKGDTKTLGSTDVVVEVGDHIISIVKPTLTAGLIINQGMVTDTNEITIEFGNLTAGAIDAGSETYTIIVLKG